MSNNLNLRIDAPFALRAVAGAADGAGALRRPGYADDLHVSLRIRPRGSSE